jgi:hypothetical protein
MTSQWDADCNTYWGNVNTNPWFTSHSILTYPVSPFFNCTGDCTSAVSYSCNYVKVIDAIFIIAGAVVTTVGALLHKKNKTLGWVLLAIGVALMVFGIQNIFTGLLTI